MESARPSPKIHIGEVAPLFARVGAVPEAGSAVDAFLAVKERNAAVGTRRDRLTRAHLDTDLGAAFLAFPGVHENNMVCVTVRGLDLAA